MYPDRLKRVFDLMSYLATSAEGRTLSEISQDLDLPVSSTHDLLRAMVGARALAVVDRRYALGPLSLRLGFEITDSLTIREAARVPLRELAGRIGSDVYLAIKRGNRVVYVDRHRGTRALNVDIRLGESLYLHSTAVGKLYAAYDDEIRVKLWGSPRPKLTSTTITELEMLTKELNRIRSSGVSVSREESVEGAVGMAVPVWDMQKSISAALHVSALRGQLGRDQWPRVTCELKKTAAAIAAQLGVETSTTAA